jgi:type VI secretion system secreted protein Hcp
MVGISRLARLFLLSQGSGIAPQPGHAVAGVESIYGSITGQKQGYIRGGVTLKGREGTYAIQSLDNGLSVPFDQSSGQVSGQRQHKPLTFSMQIDEATPLFINAVANNENLTKTKFDFWRTDANGVDINYFTIELVNGRVTSYEGNATSGAAHLVTFVLAYQKITWTWNKGGITSSDDWETPG